MKYLRIFEIKQVGEKNNSPSKQAVAHYPIRVGKSFKGYHEVDQPRYLLYYNSPF